VREHTEQSELKEGQLVAGAISGADGYELLISDELWLTLGQNRSQADAGRQARLLHLWLHPTPQPGGCAPSPPPFWVSPTFSLSGQCGAWHRTESPHCTRTLVSGARIKRSTRSPCFFFWLPDGGGDGRRRDRDKIRENYRSTHNFVPPHWTGVAMTLVSFFFCSFSFFLDGVTRRLDILVRECRKSTRWSEHGVNAGEKEARTDVCFQPQEDYILTV
jgi:hypothetical protein